MAEKQTTVRLDPAVLETKKRVLVEVKGDLAVFSVKVTKGGQDAGNTTQSIPLTQEAWETSEYGLQGMLASAANTLLVKAGNGKRSNFLTQGQAVSEADRMLEDLASKAGLTVDQLIALRSK